MTTKGTMASRVIFFLLALAVNIAVSAQTSEKLSGTPIGSQNVDYSTGRPSDKVNTPACAFDGDLRTFYASYGRSNTWVGLDLGTPHVITKVGWCPRQGQPTRVQLGIFEGSNSPDFLDAVPLYLIPSTGTDGVVTYANVNVSRGFRYVRYLGPNDARCNIGELEFHGYEGEGTDEAFYQVSSIPTVSIHTYTGAEITSKTYDLEANITITYDNGTRIQEYPILARGRGNASWGFPKKPMRIKFNDGKSHHMLKDSPQESPAKAKKWTLINNYGDKTLMRNIIAFEMSRRLGMPYTPYCQPVDVIFNGEYRGCYQLCDQISVDKDRVPITEMEVEDIAEPELTGGYLLEVDAYASRETSWFTSSKGIPVTIKSPDDENITREQKSYIRTYFNKLESALWSTKFSDPETGYRSKLDVESFLGHFIVGEFAGNTDTYWSTYMYKNREDDIFRISPVWDFDLAFENDNRTYPINNLSDWIYRTKGSAASGMTSFVSRVLSDPYADSRLKAKWKEMRKSRAFTESSLLAYIDSTAKVLDTSQRLNFKRWPILSTKVHQNPKIYGSYQGEVNNVKEYVKNRILWIDNKLGYTDTPEYVDTTYYISTAEELIEFATAVNSGANGSEGYLTKDIDMASHSGKFTPIGTAAKPFHGKFDGQGHRIFNLNIKGTTGIGFFGIVASGANISRLILDSSCNIQGSSYVGMVALSSGDGIITLSQLGNEATITGTGKNVGGILGCNMGSAARFVVSNCYNTGAITGKSESGAIAGLLGENGSLQNCWNSGTVSGTESRYEFARGSVTPKNCYSTVGRQGNIVTPEQMASGEVCYKLNGGQTSDVVWHQTLGEDLHPTFDTEHGTVYYDEEVNYYYNNPEDIPDGLHQISQTAVTEVYDITGRRLNSWLPDGNTATPKGVYIVNGKKTIVR